MRIVFTFGLLITCSSCFSARSAEVVVFGDSWGVPFAPALRHVIDERGIEGVSVANAAFNGETAAQLSSSDQSRGLPYITNILNANPDAEIVHLSIGANDFLGNWTSQLSPASET